MYETAQDPYCYEGTSVLKNIWNIQNESDLAEAEAMFAQQRIAELYVNRSVIGRYGLAHLQKIHKFIFQDIYSWAGKLRTVRISKGQSVFAYPECIVSEANHIFAQLRQEHYLSGLSKENFVARCAWYISEVNTLHPFREGNGRALRVFMWFLGRKSGWEIQFENIDAQAWLNACIASYGGNYRPMEEVLMPIVNEIEI